jgi:chaperone BCS1
MEDIDAAFHHSISRTLEKPAEASVNSGNEQGKSPDNPPKVVSLSGLLNALDGIGAQEGRLLFATTNRYEALDPALRRPGRMDVHVEFKLASQHQASELFRRFYAPENTAGRRVEGVPNDGDSDKDSGYSTPPKDKKLMDVELPQGEGLDLANLVFLSEKFKEHIPDREISMAALQGYLMTHKGRPYDAVERVGVWVQEEKAKVKEVKDTVENTTSGCAPQLSQGQESSHPDANSEVPPLS